MIAPWPYWGLVSVIHLAWAIALPGRQSKAAALLGALIAAASLVMARRRSGGDRETAASGRGLAMLAPFLLPALSFAATPQFAFWWLDGRAWIIVSWLIVAAIGALRTDEGAPRARLWVGIFVFWCCAFWATVVWDAGMRDLILFVDRTIELPCRTDPLSTMFKTWEKHPASEHLFLGWRPESSFEKKEPYANHVHPFLLSMYAWIVAVRAATGLPMPIASNTTILLQMLVVLVGTSALLARLGLLRRGHEPGGLIVLFLGYGFLITTWRFWIDLFQFQSDTPFPLAAGLYALVCASFVPPVRPWMAIASSLVFVALTPINAPFLILAAACVFGQPAATVRDLWSRNRLIVGLAISTMALAFVVMALPRLLVVWKGYSSYSSSWLMRSGLDGSTQYFENMFQAIWRGHRTSCYLRTPAELLLPMFLPLAAFGPWGFRSDHGLPVHPAKLLLFLCTPYLCSWILFPQALSVHPYLYDLLLLIPIVIIGLVLLLTEPIRRGLTGPWLLAVMLFMGALIMTNLTTLAQMIVVAKGAVIPGK
jgi:hypothetical protein